MTCKRTFRNTAKEQVCRYLGYTQLENLLDNDAESEPPRCGINSCFQGPWPDSQTSDDQNLNPGDQGLRLSFHRRRVTSAHDHPSILPIAPVLGKAETVDFNGANLCAAMGILGGFLQRVWSALRQSRRRRPVPDRSHVT